jgi:hypothetical protein
MQTLEYRTMDKTSWGDGPWMMEPDKKQFVDEKTGYPCLIVRNPWGALCGYVGVPAGHRAYGLHYDSVNMPNGDYIDVHGGLTYADFCTHTPEEKGICHKVEPGENDKVWWLGFDAGHAYDLCPGMEHMTKAYREHVKVNDVYRDFAYMESEVAKLASQLKEIGMLTWRERLPHLRQRLWHALKYSRLGWRIRMSRTRRMMRNARKPGGLLWRPEKTGS